MTSTAQQPSFAVILPMKDEEQIARECILGIAGFLDTLENNTAIIAVNDGSTDGTQAVLERTKGDVPSLIIEQHTVNQGYGGACRTGMQSAVKNGFDYALVMDADGTQDPKYIKPFIEKMQQGVTFIKATRYHKDGGTVGVPWQRSMVSYVGNKIAKAILRLPISDYTNGFRAVHRDIIANLQTKETGFSVLVEEVRLAKKLHATFAQVPYILTCRQADESTSKFCYRPRVFISYLQHLFGKES